MKPYYDADGVTIYHGDCREILPQLAKVPLILTDPPYALGSRDVPVVLDPFMGSGRLLCPAVEAGRKVIGIEIEERYCELAAKKLINPASFNGRTAPFEGADRGSSPRAGAMPFELGRLTP